MLLGLPLMRHLQVYTKTLFKITNVAVDGADSRSVGNPTMRGCSKNVRRISLARRNRIVDDSTYSSSLPSKKQTQLDNKIARKKPDPFPVPLFLYPIDRDQREEIRRAAIEILESVKKKGMLDTDVATLRGMVINYLHIFLIGLYADFPAQVNPPKNKLIQYARSTGVCLRNFSQEQSDFM